MRKILQFLIILLITFIVSPVYANEVVATGTGSTFESALHDAMRIAIERSIGAFVSSRTITANQQLITDEILVKSGGFIEGYDILRQEQYAGIFEVEVKVKVRTEELRNTTMSILEKRAIVEMNLNDPVVAVIAKDIDGNRYFDVEDAIADALYNAGFTRITTDDTSCDYALEIDVKTSKTHSKTYAATLAVKMSNTETGEILYSASFTGRSRMFTNNSVDGAIETATNRAVFIIPQAILNRVAFTVFNRKSSQGESLN